MPTHGPLRVLSHEPADGRGPSSSAQRLAASAAWGWGLGGVRTYRLPGDGAYWTSVWRHGPQGRHIISTRAPPSLGRPFLALLCSCPVSASASYRAADVYPPVCLSAPPTDPRHVSQGRYARPPFPSRRRPTPPRWPSAHRRRRRRDGGGDGNTPIPRPAPPRPAHEHRG